MKFLFLADTILLHQEPMGITILSAVLKRAGHETKCINVEAVADVHEEVERFAPDVLGYSVSTLKAKRMLEINREVKKRYKAFSIFGGAHATYVPDVIESEGLDAICRGEGEEAVLELMDALEGKRSLTDIKNLWVKHNGKIYKNELRAPVEDLDTLPFPDRDLVRGMIAPEADGTNFAVTGRGCPFNCTFCVNEALHKMTPGRLVRRRSVVNVVEELRQVKEKYGTRFISFQDDAFTVNGRWLAEFADLFPREVGVPFACHGRADEMKEERVESLARAGCLIVSLGIEAGDDRQRNEILRKRVTREKIVEAAHRLRRYGIMTLSFNMFGIPHDTIRTTLETIRLNRDCQVGVMENFFYSPYPATALTEYSIEHGFFDGDFDTLPHQIFETVSLKLPDKADIISLHRLANACLDFRGYFEAVEFVSKLPKPLRRLGFYLLEKKAASLRAQGRGRRDTRYQHWWTYHERRNPYAIHGADWLEPANNALSTDADRPWRDIQSRDHALVLGRGGDASSSPRLAKDA